MGKRLLGAHMSIAGGVHEAVLRGHRAGCTAIQIFTKNNNQWSAKPLGEEDLLAFQNALQQTKVTVSLAHCAYLINLASPNPALWERSFASMQTEVLRAAQLGIPYLVLHPGSHAGSGVQGGIERIVRGINLIHKEQSTEKPVILLEFMAGQGSSLGSKIEELQEVISLIDDQQKIGVCIDTCHLFAAGYDIRTAEAFSQVTALLEEKIGLEKIKAFHLNDSKKGLGCRVDRHEHIGQGAIGLEAFRYLLNEPRFSGIPMVLETPKSQDDAFDLMNLKALRDLISPLPSVLSQK